MTSRAMRFPSFSPRHVARRQNSASTIALNTLLTISSFTLIPTSRAISFTPAPEANLELSELGRVGIAGDFSGLSLFEFEEQNERPFNTTAPGALLARMPNGAFASIVQTDASVQSMCSFIVDGTLKGVIVAGNFTSLGGLESTAVALFNTNTSTVEPLPGISGSVYSVYCDNDKVYVGGNFKANNSTNAISWVNGSGWTNLPFAGFNGPVTSITKASNGNIIFGGSFTGLGNASTPSEPDEQVINLSTATITSTGSSTTDGFSDPSNIICKTSGVDGADNTWLLADGVAGSWQAAMGFGYRPTKLRLYNTHQDGRGTQTWRFTALPINGIMNFTYIDPETNQNLTCTSECPLSSNSSVTFQDFHFVNVIGMNAFRIDISAFYGSGGGLNGIELFSDDIFSYAINEFNEPTCSNTSTVSSATKTGPWLVSPSLQSTSQYLTAQLSGTITSDSASVTFTPDIRESGYYTVNMYTPGCLQDNTCDSRGQVKITGTMSPSLGANGTIDVSLYQTNFYDKFDQIYFNYVDATSSSFQPAVILTPLDGQSLDNLTIVAQRVGFQIYNTTGGLNGLFEYDPANTTISTSDFQNSVFDKLGMNFTAGSAVNALTTSGDVTYIGGNFTSITARNLISINSQDSTVQSLDSGLNGYVMSMYANGTSLWVGGTFNNTQDVDVTGLSNVAVYDTSSNTWSPLGAGVDGPVFSVVPLTMNITSTTPELVISLTGKFGQLNAFGSNAVVSADGFAVWVPSQSNWLGSLDLPVEFLDGALTTSLLDIPGSAPLYAGSVASSTLNAVGAATLDDTIGKFAARIQGNSATSSSSGVTERDIDFDGVSGVVDGAFLSSNGLNITVLAGHFTATATNGSTINNVLVINGSNNDSVSGFASGVLENSSFVAVAIQGTTLFAGGDVSGTVDGGNITGLVSFNLQTNDFASQPPALAGGNGTVSAIAVRPDSGDVYVGGSFTSAGSLGCPAVCVYSTTASQWNRPGSNVGGTVNSMVWATTTSLVAAGNLTINGTSPAFLVSYDSGSQIWDIYPGSSVLPGPVDVVTVGSKEGDKIWVAGTATTNGSVYLMKYDGSDWIPVAQTLETGTKIHSLQVFTLTQPHDPTSVLDEYNSLMLSGRIAIPGFGNSSAALFNGTVFTPFGLTTKPGNTAGTIARFFVEKSNFFTGDNGEYSLTLHTRMLALADFTPHSFTPSAGGNSTNWAGYRLGTHTSHRAGWHGHGSAAQEARRIRACANVNV